MNRNDLIRLHHILNAAREALSFASERTRSDLYRDRMLTLSLVKEVEIIGEAAANISQETRDLLPQFEWKAIISMRNKLVHMYYKIDLYVLWDTVELDLPQLLKELEKLPELSNADSTY